MRKEGEFNSFVRKLWIERGFTLRQLCSGLCSVATMEAMTEGKWELDKQLQDRILERLGVDDEGYVRILYYDEYVRWEAEHHILHSITFGEIECAGKLLEEYREKYCKDSRLEEQFYLAIGAQLRNIQGYPREELLALYEEALKRTVPESELGKLEKLALSVKELNLLLEVEYCRGRNEQWERYQEVVEYIDKSGLDGMAKAKIYPKAIYYLCRCAVKENRTAYLNEIQVLLQYCEQGIELLQEYKRMYYLWELLEMEGQLAYKAVEKLRDNGQPMWALALEERSQKKAEWKLALEEIYAEYNIPKEMADDCYLYVMEGVYCINDVVRIRREMLGISRKELCSGICDVRTLRRLEQGMTKPQKEIAKRLLERLGLSGEFTRTELVTENPEAGRLMKQLRKQINAGCWDKTEVLWERIKGMIPMDISCNRQAVVKEELLAKWGRGKMDHEIYCMKMREALELTLPYEVFLKEGEKYLTNEERMCIVNHMQGIESNGEEYQVCMRRLKEFYEPYVDKGLWEAVWNEYEIFLGNLGSAYRNVEKYDKADYYERIILEGCLRFRRMGKIHSSIYGRWRNYYMRKKDNNPIDKVPDDEEELSKCILFSVMVKDKCGEQFYRNLLCVIQRKE